MLLHCLGGVGYAANSYLVTDSRTGHALLFDGSAEPEEVRRVLQEESCTLSAVLLTHGHFDHMLNLPELKAGFQCPVYVGAADLPLLSPESRANVAELMFGRKFAGCEAQALPDGSFAPGGIPVKVFPAPGHTAGGVFYELPGFFITGDTLMAGSCGRSDLPTGSRKDLRASLTFLAGRLRRLPGSTLICPGHGPQTTAEEELLHNTFLNNPALI